LHSHWDDPPIVEKISRPEKEGIVVAIKNPIRRLDPTEKEGSKVFEIHSKEGHTNGPYKTMDDALSNAAAAYRDLVKEISADGVIVAEVRVQQLIVTDLRGIPRMVSTVDQKPKPKRMFRLDRSQRRRGGTR